MKKCALLLVLSILTPSAGFAATVALPDSGNDGRVSISEALYALSVVAGQPSEPDAAPSLVLPDIFEDGALGLGEAIYCLAVAAGTVPNDGVAVRAIKAPPYPNTAGEPLEGEAVGIIPADYKLAVYIRVGDAWYTKPTADAPETGIAPDGAWSCDVTTGGQDAYAGAAAVYLLPVDAGIPICNPCYETPEIPEASAMAETVVGPPTRTLDFAGYRWEVKRRVFPAGPGGNYFSDSEESVWTDADGLHLTVRSVDGKWACSEVILTQSLGYGTYAFTTKGRIDAIDPRMVLGMFTWDPTASTEANRELDIEYTRWGDSENETNAQFAVQPCDECPGCEGRCTRFSVDLSGGSTLMTHYLIWEENRVEFSSHLGAHGAEPPPDTPVHGWRYEGTAVPEPGKEAIHLNLWLFRGEAPETGGEAVFVDFNWSG